MSGATQGWRMRPRWLQLSFAAPRYGWALVMGWLVALYYATNYLLPHLGSAELNIYVLQPLLWSSLGAFALWRWRRETRDVPFVVSRWLVTVAALAGVFQVALLVLSGLLMGFGYSPYADRLHLMMLNLWFVGTRLAGLELARWYLVLTLGQRRVLPGAAVVWLLFLLLVVPPASYGQLGEFRAAFPFVGRVLLPEASESLLATYLVFVGGPLASIAYRGVLEAFEWFSPILPNVRWTVHAFVGTVAPALGLLIVRDLLEWRASPGQEGEARGSSRGTGWVLVAVLVVFIFWFNTGLFGVRPALISGVSMEPTMKMGDIAITREVPPESIAVGDIVRFRVGGSSSILHRVVEIRDEGGRMVFVTKGDNNNVEDQPVEASQLEGKLVATVPKVGWVPIGLRKLLALVL